MRLAMTLSCTSLVPPSIELALVRSQSRGRAAVRALAFPFERVAAAAPTSAVRGGACSARCRSTSAPTRKRRMRLARLAPGRRSAASARGRPPRRPRTRRCARAAAGRRAGRCASRPTALRGHLRPAAATARARRCAPIISRSCVSRYLATSQPPLGGRPGCASRTRTLSKKVSQNGDLPEISRIGLVLTPGAGHVEQHEADAGVLLRRAVGAHQAEDPVGLVGVAGPDLLAVDEVVVAAVLGARRPARPGPSRRWARNSPGTSGSRRARSSAGARASAPRCRTSAAPGPSIQMPKLVSGARQLERAHLLRAAPWPRSAIRPPPPYSRGQVGTVQPRSPMRCSHRRCASDWNLALRPPQQMSSSLAIGWRISAGQLASSQARVSARKSSVQVSAGVVIGPRRLRSSRRRRRRAPGRS